MSLTFRAPGHGRRHAKTPVRIAAKDRRRRDRDLKHELEGAGWLIESLRTQLEEAHAQHRAEVAQVARVLGDEAWEVQAERDAHAETRRRLDTAVRSNRANENAETVQTDVTALRATIADIVPEDARPVAQYRPFWRLPKSAIRVVPLWHSPQAAHPARIPGAGELAGAR